jgi:DNA-3-methyladenine glycosylase II
MSGTMISHLSADKKLAQIITVQGELKLHRKKNVYLHLCSSIMSQQLSTKVADIIHRRFLDLFGKKEPSPQQILDMPFEKLRAIGLSNAKAQYVHNVCRFFLDEKITDARLYKMPEEEAIAYLSQIKGVGRWTVEMVLMFTLGREDVFAVDDLGIQQAMCSLYKIDPTDKKKMKEQMLKRSLKWAPYRTYACMYLCKQKVADSLI